MDVKSPFNEQATFIQLQARLEVLENMKREMSAILYRQQTEYDKVCKKLKDVSGNFCNEVGQFVRRDSIYYEAQKNRQLQLGQAFTQLQKEKEKVDCELTQLITKEKVVLAEKKKLEIAETEIEKLRQRMKELKSELKVYKETIEKLEKEKVIVDEYPIRDATFLRLKETLIAARELEHKNEQAFKNLAGLP